MDKEKLYFNNCTTKLLNKLFGLRRTFEPMPALQQWLNMPIALTEHDHIKANGLQHYLNLNVMIWNEQELSLHFIGPMFSIAEFTIPYRFNLFAQRQISAELGNYELLGKPDGLIASGYEEPEIPFFAFSEFKKEQEPSGDPAAQCLAAMLVGQVLNQSTELPMYGCYVNGRDWYFMTMVDKQYAISQGYDALTDDIYDIMRILKALKEIVIARTA